MFKNNGKDTKTRVADNGSATINIIGAGTVVNGDISSNGDIRIDGTVKGTVVSKAKVVIGQSSVITGNIEAQNADISGKINGNLAVTETLLLKSTALIMGDIVVNKLMVESGAEFNGKCSMQATHHLSKTENEKPQNARIIQKAVQA